MAVLDRSELDLGQMRFENEDYNNKKLLESKKALTAAFQKFIYKVLALGVSLMHLKGIEKMKRDFVCKAIAVGYFRVP